MGCYFSQLHSQGFKDIWTSLQTVSKIKNIIHVSEIFCIFITCLLVRFPTNQNPSAKYCCCLKFFCLAISFLFFFFFTFYLFFFSWKVLKTKTFRYMKLNKLQGWLSWWNVAITWHSQCYIALVPKLICLSVLRLLMAFTLVGKLSI